MRGFRGSRAVQNATSSRFGGNHGNTSQSQAETQENPSGSSHHQRPQLPEWLKTPETKAREKLEAEQRKKQAVAVAATPKTPVAAKAKPALRVVQGGASKQSV